MRVRIQNDSGIGYKTKITNAETGEDLGTHVYRVELDASKEVLATVFMYSPVVDVIADAEIKCVCPYCGRPVEDGGS